MNEINIAQPPWGKLERKLESLCRKAIFDFSLFEGIESLAIALSGGKDSLSLLFLMKALIGRGLPNIDLHAIHIENEMTDPKFKKYLSDICDKLNINFTIRPNNKIIEDLNCYKCSRTRRNLIFEIAKEKNISTVAFGHHREDNIETLLMNLFHKGEFCSMLPKLKMIKYDITIIRPLIYVSEKEIIEFVKKYDYLKITCECPRSSATQRKITQNIIKHIEKDFPNIRSNLSSASFLYGSDKAKRI